ncbi:hypothetical protein DEA98_22885 [Brucella pseudogrignonensis]|nr:hypothetical protein [Brucella pseudogrignonensis]
MTDKQPNAATAKIFDLAADAFQPLPSDDWIWSTAKSCRGRDPTPEYLQASLLPSDPDPAVQKPSFGMTGRRWRHSRPVMSELCSTDTRHFVSLLKNERNKRLQRLEAHAKAIIDAHVEKIEGGTPAISNKPTLN